MSICPQVFNYFPHYKWKNQADNQVMDQVSGRVYGVTYDTPKKIRLKLIILAVAIPIIKIIPTTVFRMIFLIRGDSIRVGYGNALKEWQVKIQNWSLSSEVIAPPKFYKIVIKQVVCETLKRISKIIINPLAVIAFEFAILYGLFNPYSGRALFGAIEDALADDLNPINNNFLFRFGEYLAICMQPKDVWKTNNFYRFRKYYNPRTIQSLFLKITSILDQKKKFFSLEGMDVQTFLSNIQKYNKSVFLISDAWGDETDNKGNLRQSMAQNIIAKNLNSLLNQLHLIETAREAKVLEQLTAWNQTKDKTTFKKEGYIDHQHIFREMDRLLQLDLNVEKII